MLYTEIRVTIFFKITQPLSMLKNKIQEIVHLHVKMKRIFL